MKIRRDFITNSSSSSFILDKKDLTPLQIDQLINYQKYASIFIKKYHENKIKEIEKVLEKKANGTFNEDIDEDYDEDDKIEYLRDNPFTEYSTLEQANRWIIKNNSNTIEGYVSVNDFNMENYFIEIGLNPDNIRSD